MKLNKKGEPQFGCQLLKLAVCVIVLVVTVFGLSSCGDDDDDPKSSSGFIGTWVYEESETYEDEWASVKMTLKFNKDNTGSIVEEWEYESRATSHNVYSMNFSWSTTSDSNGRDMLRVSYVSGDKETELFPGSSSTVLWTREFVLTGKILNIYSGSSNVWVFNKK